LAWIRFFGGFSEDTLSLRSMTSQRSAAVARRLHHYLVISAVGFLLVSLACVCVERQFGDAKTRNTVLDRQRVVFSFTEYVG
jgi:hypothetical protein